MGWESPRVQAHSAPVQFGSGAARLRVSPAQWSPNTAGAGQPAFPLDPVGYVSRGFPSPWCGCEVCGSGCWQGDSELPPPKHQHDRSAPGQGQPWLQGIAAHAGATVSSAPRHPKSIFHRAGSCGLRIYPCGSGCNQYPDTGVPANCSRTEINWTETWRTLQNAVVKGQGGSWRHRGSMALWAEMAVHRGGWQRVPALCFADRAILNNHLVWRRELSPGAACCQLAAGLTRRNALPSNASL